MARTVRASGVRRTRVRACRSTFVVFQRRILAALPAPLPRVPLERVVDFVPFGKEVFTVFSAGSGCLACRALIGAVFLSSGIVFCHLHVFHLAYFVCLLGCSFSGRVGRCENKARLAA